MEKPEAKPKAQKEISLGDDHELQVAKAVVEEMLDKLKVFAKVAVRYVEPEERSGERSIFIEITGEDLSILIGRKSEILNALQYLMQLDRLQRAGEMGAADDRYPGVSLPPGEPAAPDR